MSKYFYDIEQHSEAWDNIRLGIPTASKFCHIITPQGKQSSVWRDFAHKLVAERILKRQVDFSISGSPALERGQQLEPEAIRDYQLQTDRDTKACGFVMTGDGIAGCSPDRLVGDDGLLEIKCPYPQTQIHYLVTRKVHEKYYPQLQGQLYVTGREWVDIYSYHPELPRAIIRVERDPVYLHCLDSLLKRMHEYMQNAIIEIADNMKEQRVRPDSITKLLDKTNTERPRIGI